MAEPCGPCQDRLVAKRAGTPPELAVLIDRMFDQVLDEPDRAELLGWIQAWESANPDIDAAHRITGWIDVAYAYQAAKGDPPVATGADRAETPGAGRGWTPSIA